MDVVDFAANCRPEYLHVFLTDGIREFIFEGYNPLSLEDFLGVNIFTTASQAFTSLFNSRKKTNVPQPTQEQTTSEEISNNPLIDSRL